jgi:hypothetical protein
LIGFQRQNPADPQSVQVYLVVNLRIMVQENQVSRMETEGMTMMVENHNIQHLNPFKIQTNELNG